MWVGLFRSQVLITVCRQYISSQTGYANSNLNQAYKFIFTSPSSVDKEVKATRSGNARIHGMTEVTLPSIAYTATQVFYYNNFFCVANHNS